MWVKEPTAKLRSIYVTFINYIYARLNPWVNLFCTISLGVSRLESLNLSAKMTDSARTPQSSTAGTPPVSQPSLEAQAFGALKRIAEAPQIEGAPRGGVTFTSYGPAAITGTFTFPVERITSPDGEIVRIVKFVSE
jgi:hypothetical protein